MQNLHNNECITALLNEGGECCRRTSPLFVSVMNRMFRAQRGCPPGADPLNLVNQSFNVTSFNPL